MTNYQFPDFKLNKKENQDIQRFEKTSEIMAKNFIKGFFWFPFLLVFIFRKLNKTKQKNE